MTTKFFYDNYKLIDMEIKKVFIKDNELVISFVQQAYLELIANGYRPEMNVDYNNTFKFKVNHTDKKYKVDSLKEIKYEDNLIFIFDNERINIIDNNVTISAK